MSQRPEAATSGSGHHDDLVDKLRDRVERERRGGAGLPGEAAVPVTFTEVPNGIEVRLHLTAPTSYVSAFLGRDEASDWSADDTPILPRLAALLTDRTASSETVGVVRQPSLAEVTGRLARYHAPRRDTQLRQLLATGTDVLLIGPSASGKTMSALAMARSYLSKGWPVLWLDLVESRMDPRAFVLALLTVPRAERVLVVLDNIQANVSGTRDLWATIDRLRGPGLDLVTLGVGWPSARSLASSLTPATAQVAAHGDEVISELLLAAGMDDVTGAKVSSLAQGDVVVASTALDFHTSHAEVPDLDRLIGIVAARTGADRVTDAATRRLLYWFTCLGIYEIDVDLDYEVNLDPVALSQLREAGLVRLDGHSLRVGHRSLASILAHYAWRNWRSPETPLDHSATVAVSYLRGVGDEQVRATLEKLDLIALAESDARDGSAFLARAWQSLKILGNYLVRQTLIDPTWGDNVASATFAAQALAQLEQVDAWDHLAGYIRGRWHHGPGDDLPTYAERPPADRDDFNAIFRTMQAEDRARRSPHWTGVRAEDVDLDRMHRTWVLGLLLGFEGSALRRDAGRLDRLHAIAEAVQEPSGAFYPDRVPWITARVVLGLCRAGGSYVNSKVVKDACDWLRTSQPDGPHAYGAWESGTGTWNSTLMTTAMCLAALGAAGVAIHDRPVKAGLSYLREQRDRWATDGGEIDLATVLEATLLAGERWQDVASELIRLLSWTRDARIWSETSRLASDVNDESSKVPYVAAQLVAIVWATVKRELPVLLEGAIASMEPVGGRDDSDALDPYRSILLSEAVRRCERLRVVIDENIADRERAVRGAGLRAGPVLDTLAEWRSRSEKLADLTARLAGEDEPPTSVIAELDALGRLVEGDLWRPVLGD